MIQTGLHPAQRAICGYDALDRVTGAVEQGHAYRGSGVERMPRRPHWRECSNQRGTGTHPPEIFLSRGSFKLRSCLRLKPQAWPDQG